MFACFKKSPVTSIGFDINSELVRSVELKKTNDCYFLTSYSANVDMAANRNKNVIVAIPYGAAISKIVQLDAGLGEEEIEKYLTMNIKRYTGFNAEDISMDFNILGPAENNSNKIDVELIAAKREQVAAKISLLRQYGVNVKAVDVEPFALQRAALAQLPKESSIAVFNVKQNSLLFCVIQQKKMLYVKEENIAIEIDIEKQILAELQMFFAANVVDINHILITGDVRLEDGLVEHIAEQTNIRTSGGNPFINMELAPQINRKDLNRNAHLMMLSCGLALWRFDHG